MHQTKEALFKILDRIAPAVRKNLMKLSSIYLRSNRYVSPLTPPANVKLIKEALKPRTRVERELVDGGSVVITDRDLEIKGKAGLLTIGDTQITLHIYLPHVSEESLEMSPAPDPKFHFGDNCSTLQK